MSMEATRAVSPSPQDRQARVPQLAAQLEKQIVCINAALQTLRLKLAPIRIDKPIAVDEKLSADLEEGPSHIVHLEHLTRLLEENLVFVNRMVEEVEL